MERYPTHRNGLAVNAYEIGYRQPSPAELCVRGLVNIHHTYWPHSVYNETFISRTFKNAAANTIPMYATEHNKGRDTLHTRFKPPRIPSLGIMVDFLEEQLDIHGYIDCIDQKKTSEHYLVTKAQFARGLHAPQHQVGSRRASCPAIPLELSATH